MVFTTEHPRDKGEEPTSELSSTKRENRKVFCLIEVPPLPPNTIGSCRAVRARSQGSIYGLEGLLKAVLMVKELDRHVKKMKHKAPYDSPVGIKKWHPKRQGKFQQ